MENEPVKNRRHRPTMAEHISHYDELLDLLDKEIDHRSRNKEKGVRTFRTFRKFVKNMRKELPIVTKRVVKRNASSKNGLTTELGISEELATFLQVPKDTKISRIDVMRAICVYSKFKDGEERENIKKWGYLNPEGKRNLQNPEDKTSIVPDKVLSSLLRYEEYRNDVINGKVEKNTKNKLLNTKTKILHDDPKLYYWVIQKLIKIHFVK